MLDLDKYMEISKKVKVLGMELNVKQPTVAMIERVNTIERNLTEEKNVKQPTVAMIERVNTIERNLTEENILEKRVEVAEIIVNNNREGIKIEKKQLKELSRSALELLIAVSTGMIKEADQDPN